MDGKSNRDWQEEEIPEEKNINDSVSPEHAGPSRAYLPGAIQSPKIIRPGLSKSEHNIRQIITAQDVNNALKSLSFGTTTSKNVNMKDLIVPILNNDANKEANESTTLLEIKNFMASCFKINKENPVLSQEISLQASCCQLNKEKPGVLGELQSVHPDTGNKSNERQELPNASCNVQTECLPVLTITNEVIVTNIEPKELKEKKKTAENLSDLAEVALAQRDSLSSIGSNVCRICMTRGRERLISPCNCKGSLANVHLSCLERWLNQVGRNHCELCGYSYPAIRTPRYTVLQALRLWFGNPRNRSHLQSDCLIFWLLSTVTAGLLAVCVVGTQYFVIEGNKFGKLDAAGLRKEEGISHRITETAMDFFMAIVLCGYSVTVYLLWKDHYVMWNRWRRANVNVRLLLAPDVNPVPFVPRSRSRYNVV